MRGFCRRGLAAAGAVAVMALAGCGGTSPKASSDEQAARRNERADHLAYQHLTVGSIAFSEGDYQTAATHYEQALRFDPDSYEIRMSLAESYFRLRELEKAVATAEALQPRDIPALEMIGKCYRYAGRNDDAEKIYQHIIAMDSTNASAQWYVARLLMHRGHATEGAGHLETAARLRGEPQGFNEAGEVYLQTQQFEEAAKAFDESLRRDSSGNNIGAYVGMAEAHEGLDQPDDARAAYREAIARQPHDLSLRRRLINHFLFEQQRDSAQAAIEDLLDIDPENDERLRLGVLLYDAGNIDRAESLFTAIEQDRGGYMAPFYLGRIAQEREDYTTAKQDYNRVIELVDTIPDGWLHLISVLLEQDSIEAGYAVAERAAAKLSEPKTVWHFLGAMFAQRNHYDTALVWLQRAYEADSTDTRVQFAVASALERTGRFAESALMFSSLLRREPDNAPALNYLGYMYADSGVHLEESLKMIKHALVLEPNNGAYLDSYGWVLYRLGRLEEAEIQIRKALDVVDSDPTILEHLGDILEAQGRIDEAREHWQRALDIDPENTALKARID
jgi:tetratricopeptide (TPR) repeat protein